MIYLASDYSVIKYQNIFNKQEIFPKNKWISVESRSLGHYHLGALTNLKYISEHNSNKNFHEQQHLLMQEEFEHTITLIIFFTFLEDGIGPHKEKHTHTPGCIPTNEYTKKH